MRNIEQKVTKVTKLRFLSLCTLYFSLVFAASANTNYTWHFTNDVVDLQYVLSDSSLIAINTNGASGGGTAELVLQAESKYRTTYAEYTTNLASLVNGRFGPNVSIRLPGSPGSYPVSGEYTSRIIDGGTAVWDMLQFRASGTDYVPDPNLLKLYRMDNDDWLDYVSGNYGTPENGPSFTSDAKAGTAAGLFRGPTYRDSVLIGSPGLLSGKRALTVACWIKMNKFIDQGSIFLHRGDAVINLTPYFPAERRCYFQVQSPAGNAFALSPSGALSTNQWYFLVGTWDADAPGPDSGKPALYIDGVLSANNSAVANTQSISQNSSIRMGRDPNIATWCFDGILDEMAIWDRALSSNEVARLYKSYYFAYPLRFQVRSGSSTSDVASKTFVGYDGTPDTFYTGAKEKLVTSTNFDVNDQYVQYKATLLTDPAKMKTPLLEAAGFVAEDSTVYSDLTAPELEQGAFSSTTMDPPAWDTPFLGITKKLNGGYYTSGAYTSRVFDAGVATTWQKLDWDVATELPATTYGLVDLWRMDGDWASAAGGPGGTGFNDDFTDGSTTFAKLGAGSAVFNGNNSHVVFNINTNVQGIEFWINDELPSDGVFTLNYNTTNTLSLTIENRTLGVTGPHPVSADIYVNGISASRLLPGWNHVAVNFPRALYVNSLDFGVAGVDYMLGQADDLAVYSRQVSRGEAYLHYQNAPGSVGGRVAAQIRYGNSLPLTNAFTAYGSTNSFYDDGNPIGLIGYQYLQYKLFFTGDGNLSPAVRSIAVNSTATNFIDDTREEILEGGFVNDTTSWFGDAMSLEKKSRFGPVNVVPDGFTEGVWHMDEETWGVGATVIDSHRGRHGTPTGANPAGGAVVGTKCGNFSGSNSYVSIPSLASAFAGDFSVHLWFKSDDTNLSAIISCDDGSGYYTVEMNGDGTGATVPGAIGFIINDGSVTRRLASQRRGLNNGLWHHLSAVRSGDQMHLYIDGARDNTTGIAPFTATGTGTSLFVGKRGNRVPEDYFKGQVDELALFSRALSDAEVGNFFSGGYRTDLTAVFESDPIDNGQPAIWQTLFWSTDGTYGNRLYPAGDPQLTALWSFEGGSVTNSRVGNDLTVNGTVNWTTSGRIGDSIELGGGAGYLDVVNNPALEPAVMTIEAWVNMDFVDGRNIVDKHDGANGYRLGTTGVGLPYFMVGAKTVTGYLPVRIQKWTHILGWYDGAQLRLYMDGDLAAIDGSAVGESTQSGGDLRIGEALGGGQSFDGRIDEVAIHSRALNAGEILDHYKAGAVSLKFQCRTDNISPIPVGIFYRGPGGSAGTYFTIGSGDNMEGDIPLAQHFQFKAYLSTEDYRYAPSLNGVKVFVSSYPSSEPYVYTTQTNGYWFLGDLVSFSESRTSNPGTYTRYQVSGDTGNPPARWFYWSGTQWAQASLSNHYNDVATISTNIGSFYEQLYPKTGGVFRVRAFLHSAGDQQIALDSVNLEASEGRIVVTSPNGTENGDDAWIAGVNYDITWDWAGTVSTNVVVEFSSTGPTGAWQTVAASVDRGAGGTGSVTWAVPEVPLLTNCYMRVRDPNDATIEDISDGPFTIIRRFRVTAPNGGEKWYMGTTTNITWESSYNVAGLVEIDFAQDGTNYNLAQRIETLGANISRSKTNSYAWTIPWDTNYLSPSARIRVETAGVGEYPDASDLPFELAGVVVTEPIAGRKVKRLDVFNIQWQSQGAGTNVAIDLSSDGGATYTNIYASVANQDGTNSFGWTVNQLGTDLAVLRVRSVSDGNVIGYSPIFTLADIDVTAPDGNEVWLMDTTNQIQWTSGGAGPTVGIYISTNAGVTYSLIDGPVTNSGTYEWIVPRTVSKYAKVKVVSEGSGAQSDTNLFSVSASNFNVAGVQVMFPNLAGDTIVMGSNTAVYHIEAPEAWDPGGVNLEITYNEGGAFTNLGPGAAAYSFNAPFVFRPDYPTTKAKIRATINNSPPYTNVFDLSDQYFTVAGILVGDPTNSAVYNIGGAHQVKWVSAGAGNTAYIDYSNSGTNNFSTLTPLGVGNIETYPGQNTYNWNVAPTLLPSTNARIRVRAGVYSDISDPFTLRGIRITSPTNGVVWNVGTAQALTWTKAGIDVGAMADMWLSTDGGATFPFELTNSWPVNAGIFGWNNHPDYDPSTNAVIRMRINSSPTAIDTNIVAYSDAFTLKGIKVRQPVAGTAWELGTTQTVNFISAAAGAQATVSYSANGGGSYESTPVTNAMAIADGSNTFTWVISKSRQPSTNVVLKVAGTAYTGYSQPFTIGGVKVNRPFQFDIWAVGETNLIEWVSIGTEGTNLIELIYPTADPNFVIASAFSGASALNWLVDAGVLPGTNDSMTGVVLRVTDTGGYTGTSEPFKLVSSPRVEIAAPLGGEFWKVGQVKQIQWLKGGQMNASQFKVFWSHDDFATVHGEVLNPITFNPSNNLFSVDWTIPDELGPTKILVTNTFNSLVYDYSDEFDIAGNFRAIFPNGDPAEPELYALNQGNVSWGTIGSVTAVDLYYKYGATGAWTKINSTPLVNNPGSPGEAISGATWDPLPYTESSTVSFRVQDASYTNIFDGVTPGPYDDNDAYFPIKWYSIYWDVYYINEFSLTQRIDKLSVTDSSGWSDSDLSTIAAPILRRYPYGVYDTAWYREYFHDQVDFHWVCNSNQTRKVEMRKSEIEPDYHVLSDFTYNVSNRIFKVHSWLERAGAIMSASKNCTLSIYDNTGAEIFSTTAPLPDPNGVFWQEWNVSITDPLGNFSSDDLFFAKVEIEFSGVDYSAGMTFALRLAAGEETVQAIEAIVETATSNILVNVSGVASNVIGVSSNLNAFRTETGGSLSNIQSDVTGIANDVAGIGGLSNAISMITNSMLPRLDSLTNSISIIEPAITNISAQMTNVLEDTAFGLSRILTRPTSVAYGSTNTILYKSRRDWGAAVTITVSNGLQGVVDTGAMAEIIPGIYSFDLVCDWGTNSYIVSCRDPHPASDSMVLNVLGEDPDVVPAMVLSISNQLDVMQSQITNLEATVAGVAGTDLSGVMANLDSLSNTLSQVQAAVGTAAEGTDLSSVISAIEGINIPEGETLDLSALTRIEEQLGTLADSDSDTTFLGRIDQLSRQISQVDGTASDASKKASSAKTEAAKAAKGVDAVKAAIEKSDFETAMTKIAEIRQSVIAAQGDIGEVQKLTKLGLLYDSIYTMAKTIEDLAGREGFENFLVDVKKPGEGGEGAEGADGAIKELTTNITEMKGSMSFMMKLIDDMQNEPVVQVELIGE